ncbi:hypothetical protein [Nocardia miyunensis]|nr:hypothetical protein [Nocardia miyunensis]
MDEPGTAAKASEKTFARMREDVPEEERPYEEHVAEQWLRAQEPAL